MGRIHPLPALVLTAAAAAASPVSAQTAAVAYVQATVTDPNAAAGSLSYVTASGRGRMARVSGVAAGSLRNLRPGDEVILTLQGPSDRPVVTSVKLSRVVPAPPPVADAVASPYAWTQAVPSRPSWPNPYSRINPGLPLHPTRGSAGRGGTLTVMPAALTGAPAPPQPVAAPAVLTSAQAAPVAAVPAAQAGDEGSTVDGLRARGARDFEAAVTRVAGDARAVDAAYARYKASCPAAMAAADGSREWFGVWEGAAISADPSCAPLLDEVERAAAPIKAGMLAAHEAARRAWVLPGTMREIRRRHAMEWSGWDH